MTPTLLSYLCYFSSLSYSCLTRVSMDPRNKSEDDERVCVPDDDFTLRSLFRGGSFLLSSLRGDRRGQAIYELEKRDNRKIPGIFLQGRKIGMTFICCLLSTTTHAECTPAPDCDSIGYTETSCETTSLKCPFNTTKLKCLPCDSIYRYTCSGDNITGGVGDTCNSKYASCSCITGATFNNGACICDTSCKTIGNIVYSDKSCSSCVDSTKTAVAVVVHSDSTLSLITPLTVPYMLFASSRSDVTSLPNWSTSDLAKEDMDGVGNSQLIREFFSSDDETNNAAWYCYNLEVEGFEDKKGEWYLPAMGELYAYYYKNNLLINSTFEKLGLSLYTAPCSSSENNAQYVWRLHINDGSCSVRDKTINCSLACLLEI